MADRSSDTAASAAFLQAGGEMGERMRRLDWSTTPLGPPQMWPQSLRSTVSMLLPSKAQIILFWGPEFAVLYNDAYRPVFGAKHPQALGLPGRDAWSEIWDSQLHDLLAGVVRTGEAFWARDLLFEIERVGFREETYFDVSYDPVRVESGDVGGVYCIVTETTERVVGERRMALLKELAERNATARTARDACVLATQTLASRPQDITFALAYLDGVLQSQTPNADEQLSAAASSTVKQFRIGSASGARSGVLVVGLNPRRPLDAGYRTFLDLVADQLSTALGNAHAYEVERTRAESLAQLDRAKTMFFSNVSHEFRTPLALMLGPTEDALASPDRVLKGDALETVHRNALRLLKLVNALLDFSRIEAGRAEAVYVPTDIAELTADIASTFRSAFTRAGLSFVVDCASLSQPVFVDREMWERIVLNLLSNALKFTFEGGVQLSLHERSGSVELVVRDTGVGIPEGEMPRLLERFHRVQGTRSRTHEGSGIGLALVNELVKMHGGTLQASSQTNHGTTFTVTVPTGSLHLAADRIRISAAGTPGGRTSHLYVTEAMHWVPDTDRAPRDRALTPQDEMLATARIVLVDDNADMRDYIHRILSDRWIVDAHADGLAALQAARAQPPALVIADVMMPGLDGFELLRELKRDEVTATVPVILLSARAGEEARVEGLRAGAADYLVKPFSARELHARVDSQILGAQVRADLAKARRDAEAANRAKDEFIAMLSHELRNPLSPILTALQLMKLRGIDAAERERTIIERQVGHLVGLVDDLLDVSRITRGKIDLKKEHVEIADIVGNAVETASPLLESRLHNLKVTVPRTGCSVHADKERLSQVLANLLTNAAKYTEPRGRIEVTAHCEGPRVVVSVTDNGIGIDPDLQASIFDIFTQARHTLDRSQGGLGLGLAIVRSLVSLHDGTVSVFSDGAGHGTTLTVRLPYVPMPHLGAPQPAAMPEGVAARMPLPGATRVLVVDDNRDSAQMLSEALTALGYATHTAFDAPTALQVVQDEVPDVALLDIGLPVMSGYELARQLRETPSSAGMTLIAVTGYGQDKDHLSSASAGFDAHLVKPVDLEKLASLMVKLIKPAPSERL